jgi:hypothetical protein
MRIVVIAAIAVAIVGAVVVVQLRAPQPAHETPAPAPVVKTAPPPAVSEPPRPAPPPPAPFPKPASKAAAPTTAPETAPTTGTLHITSDVPDTSVFIDRQFLGTAPITAKDLTPGTHHLNMSATGYDGIFQDITVEAGEHDLAMSLKDIKLDEKIAVVHKHLTGSCRGMLIATPQQIRYETTDKNDAFSVALTDLETFEADYVAKNLKLKIKKGKTYNFADADDNVERLYTFQKTVDKVRQKLSGK